MWKSTEVSGSNSLFDSRKGEMQMKPKEDVAKTSFEDYQRGSENIPMKTWDIIWSLGRFWKV